jgi:hypothetical protein
MSGDTDAGRGRKRPAHGDGVAGIGVNPGVAGITPDPDKADNDICSAILIGSLVKLADGVPNAAPRSALENPGTPNPSLPSNKGPPAAGNKPEIKPRPYTMVSHHRTVPTVNHESTQLKHMTQPIDA